MSPNKLQVLWEIFWDSIFYHQSDMIIKLRTAGLEARMLPLCWTRPHVKALLHGSAYAKWTIRFLGLSWKLFCCLKCSIHLGRVLPPTMEPNVSSRLKLRVLFCDACAAINSNICWLLERMAKLCLTIQPGFTCYYTKLGLSYSPFLFVITLRTK